MPLQLRRRNGSVSPFRNSEYLPFYYFIPESILKKCGAELNAIPRNPREIFKSREACEFIESDQFLLLIIETTKECLEDLETQWDSLKASILQLQLERRKFTKEELVEWISKYKYGNSNDLDYRKEIIDTFVNSVFVYEDKLVLTYNYKNGSETLTLQEIESVLSSNLASMCPPKRNQ